MFFMIALLIAGIPILGVLGSKTTNIGRAGALDRKVRLLSKLIFMIILVIGLYILEHNLFYTSSGLTNGVIITAQIVTIIIGIFSYEDIRDSLRERYDRTKKVTLTKCIIVSLPSVRSFSKKYYLSGLDGNYKLRFTFSGNDIHFLKTLSIDYSDKINIEYFPSTNRIVSITKQGKLWGQFNVGQEDKNF